MALRLEKGIGSRADLWLKMQMAFDLARVRAREADIDVRPLAGSVV
jgi:plasmid maintenance system antidote protein VapI